MIQGGCFCKAVRYQFVGEPFDETICHCSLCRSTSGAPSLAWISVAKSGFELTCGTPARFQSSDTGVRSFCDRCGTALTFESTEFPTEIDLTTASLDDPERFPPKDETYCKRRISWVGKALPNYDAGRDRS